jgi:Holliday junction resolvase RusA-like endonuclease
MRVFLPYPPSANERLTVRKGGKGFVNTTRYRAWTREAVWIVAMAARGGKGVAGPFRLFALARPPDLSRSRDVDNLLKATCDAHEVRRGYRG